MSSSTITKPPESDSDSSSRQDEIAALERQFAAPSTADTLSPEEQDKFGEIVKNYKSDNPTDRLANQENNVASPDTVGRGYTGSATTGKRNRLLGLAKKLQSKKLLIAGAAGSGMGVVAMILLLFVFASSLKLPNLTQNIIGYEFARVSRTFNTASDRLTGETLTERTVTALKKTKLGSAAADQVDKIQNQINDFRDKITGLKDGAIGKVRSIPGVEKFIELNNKYNPLRVEKNLGTAGISIGTDARGRPTVTLSGAAADSVGLDPQTFLVKPPTGIGRFIPGYNKFLETKASNALWNDAIIQKALRTAFSDDGRLASSPVLVQGLGMYSILRDIGIGRIRSALAGLEVAKYKNADTPAQQAQVVDAEANQDIAPLTPTVGGSEVGSTELNQAATDQQQAEQAAANGSAGVAVTNALEANAGVASKSALALALIGIHSTVSKILKWIAGPLYNAAYLACVFDEGANPVSNSQIITANNNANERAFTMLASTTDQLKSGPSSNSQITEFGNAMAAMNNKVGGNVASSIPLLRASGSQYNTATEPAAQSTAYGFQSPQTVVNNSAFWWFMKAIDPGCQKITSAWAAGGAALANIAVYISGFFTGGSSDFTEGAVEAGSQSTFKTGMSNLISDLSDKIGLKYGAKTVIKKSFALFRGIIKNGLIIAGVQSLGAAMAAPHDVGLYHTGYEIGNGFVNMADAGGNALAQTQMRTMLFGRPLTESEVCQSDATAMSYQKVAFESQSTFQRYLSTTNPQSLVSRVAMATANNLGGSLSKPINSLASVVGQMSNPFGWLSNTLWHSTFAAATPNCGDSTAYYGNVQFGWSDAELNLIEGNDSYKPYENLSILAQSGKADAIAKKYARCFGYSYSGGTIQLDLAKYSIGYLLTGGSSDNPLITRDSQGNVINSNALCSPDHLSYDSTDTSLASDTSSLTPQKNDMIFRWRLAMMYNNTQNQLLSIQYANAN